MRILDLNFDAIQRAMEDTRRTSNEYYLDLETGKVIELPADILEKALEDLYRGNYVEDLDEDVVFDSELDTSAELTDQMFDNIESAIKIIPEAERYYRIPERDTAEAFSCMKRYTVGLAEGDLKRLLTKALDGGGAFRKFKDALKPFPRERKEWNRFNARMMRKVIKDWLLSYGITPVRQRGAKR